MSLDALQFGASLLLKRDITDPDTEEPTNPGQEEIFSSWALFIFVVLLIMALFTSYYLQLKKIQAVHETVISIFAGMFVGLIIRLSDATHIQNLVKFKYQIFFNLLLPPIILNSGYELHQANFFRNMGSILTFAFAGTFISAVVLGVILYLWTLITFKAEGLNISFVEAISVGATLSATDPVTILAIFNTYKVDPKLYTIIFGESILNDAVAIVMFQTAQKFLEQPGKGVGPFSFFKGVGIFFLVFMVSLAIGVFVGISTALILKHTYIRRFPRLETCLILLVAYASYLFSNGLDFSGIVSLLFCGITLKHYAYYNMSRRTQLATKYLFQALAQLSENFIFIYLGMSLFTEDLLVFKPLFILISVVGICAARWAAVFPLSKLINWVIQYRAQQRGKQVTEEIPHAYQGMLFWAGLRGAVGVALAAGLVGENANALRATVLVVVVLTVIVFGGTTARMLEILGIRTGVADEPDSDDEFDIETSNTFYRRPVNNNNNGSSVLPLSPVDPDGGLDAYSSSQRGHAKRPGQAARRQSSNTRSNNSSNQDLLHSARHESDDDSDSSDLPPAAKKPSNNNSKLNPDSKNPSPRPEPSNSPMPAMRPMDALSKLVSGTVDDQAEWFRQIDESFIKPHLLLDPSRGNHHGAGGGGSGSGSSNV